MTTHEMQLMRGVYEKALAAATAAGDAVTPTPMTVRDSATGQTWRIEDGACGFAWVVIKPATSTFVRWLKLHGIGRKNYGGGWCIWVNQYNQSMDRKEAYARAFARVLQENGIDAYAQSRLD